MRSFKRFRTICQMVGVLSGVFILISCIVDWKVAVAAGVVILVMDLIIVAIRNRCPFCHKSLRIAPIKGEEFCPYCGSKIE